MSLLAKESAQAPMQSSMKPMCSWYWLNITLNILYLSHSQAHHKHSRLVVEQQRPVLGVKSGCDPSECHSICSTTPREVLLIRHFIDARGMASSCIPLRKAGCDIVINIGQLDLEIVCLCQDLFGAIIGVLPRGC